MADDRYCFLADWFDPQAAISRRFQVLYYPSDNSVELYDVRNKRHFLKRCRAENLSVADMYLGNMITVMSRTMKIVEYGDAYTTRALSSNQQKTTALLVSGHLSKLGQIVDSIYKNGLKITKMRKVEISSTEAFKLFESDRDKSTFNTITRAISDGPVVAMELLGSDAQQTWISIIGKSDITSELSKEVLNRISESILESRRIGKNTATYVGTTCCVIKPHLVGSGMAGAALYEIQKAGFEISAIQTVNFSKPNAEEFLEVYKGVVQEYPEMVEELISGTSIAIEIKGPNAHAAFRDFCGPHDPEIARVLRPNTLRAILGIDKIKNGVHCTDLPEDTILEVEYFFRILDQS